MTNIVAVSHDSAAGYLMIWRHLLTLFSTLKKGAENSSETLVMRYHSKHCHFPEHSNLPELSCFHGTRISWMILKASSSSTPSSSAKNKSLIALFHKACHFNSIDTYKPLLSKFHFITVLQLTPASLHSENSEPTFCKNFSLCLHVHMSYVSYHPSFNDFRPSVGHGPMSVEITFHFNTVVDTNTST